MIMDSKDKNENIHFNISGYTLKNGKIVLELRKKFVLCESNEKLIKQIIFASLSNKQVKANVIISFKNKLIAKSFWIKNKPEWFKKN